MSDNAGMCCFLGIGLIILWSFGTVGFFQTIGFIGFLLCVAGIMNNMES